MNVAAADAAEAGAAPEAARAVLVVGEAFGGDAEAERSDHPAALLSEHVAHVHLGRVEAHRTLIDRVRQPRQVFRHAGDAEIAVDLVVVRSDVGVGDRPVHAVAVAARGLEVVVGEAERKAAPHVGPAAEHARAHPGEVGPGVGMILLVDEELLGVVRSFAELLPAHDVRIAAERLRVRRLEPLVVLLVEHIGVGCELAPARMVVGPFQRAHLRLEVYLLAGLQQQHVEAVGRERVRSHAAGRARAHHQHVVDLRQADRGRVRKRHGRQAKRRHISGLSMLSVKEHDGPQLPSAAKTQVRSKVKAG